MLIDRVESIAVGFPWSSPFIWTDATDNMLNLTRPKDIPIKFVRGKGWCPARRHIDICERALKWGASHILIIGADQIHPLDLIPRLVARVKEGYEVITAMVPTRGHIPGQNTGPFQPMAWQFKPNTKLEYYRGMEESMHMVKLIDPAEGDVQRVDFIGSGCIMFPVSILLALDFPWFYEVYGEKTLTRRSTMDSTFMFRLRWEGGAQCWVDTTIKIRHLNIFEIDDSYQYRFSDWVEAGYGNFRHEEEDVSKDVGNGATGETEVEGEIGYPDFHSRCQHDVPE